MREKSIRKSGHCNTYVIVSEIIFRISKALPIFLGFAVPSSNKSFFFYYILPSMILHEVMAGECSRAKNRYIIHFDYFLFCEIAIPVSGWLQMQLNNKGFVAQAVFEGRTFW